MAFLSDSVEDLSRLRLERRLFPARPSYCRSTVLFLDFDGVTHPETGLSDKAEVFCEIDRIEALFDDYPEVSIVLATSWQMLSSLDRLKTVFRSEYRDRIEGGTGELSPESYSYSRGRTAEMWMAKRGHGRRWLSLDDDARAFRTAMTDCCGVAKHCTPTAPMKMRCCVHGSKPRSTAFRTSSPAACRTRLRRVTGRPAMPSR